MKRRVKRAGILYALIATCVPQEEVNYTYIGNLKRRNKRVMRPTIASLFNNTLV